MVKPKAEELRQLNRTASMLNETLDELNEKLATTSSDLASIRAAFDALPHPADLEGLADVASRISGSLEEAKDTLEAISSGDDGERLANLINHSEN